MPARHKPKIAVHPSAAGFKPAPVSPPDKPVWLSGGAAREWERVMPILIERGRIAEDDQMALAAYCELTAEFIASPTEFPSSKMTQLRLLMADFGMTPSARDKLPQGSGKPKNTFGDLMQ